MPKQLLILLSAILFLSACGQRPSEKLEINMDDIDVEELQVPSETMDDIIQNLASPDEAAALIHSLNIPFSAEYLADPGNLSATATEATDAETAFSLGALFADLGYLNLYEKTGTAPDCLSTIDTLARALQIGQFFDLATARQLATSGSDPDSLMSVSVNSFHHMNESLRETGRGELSALMIAGAWIEGLYLSTQAAGQNSHEDLKAMIGEQKLTLNDLLLVLNNYKKKEGIALYIKDLETIKSAFDEVRITYKVGDPQAIEEDDLLLVVQRESSRISISDATMQKITEITARVRNSRI